MNVETLVNPIESGAVPLSQPSDNLTPKLDKSLAGANGAFMHFHDEALAPMGSTELSPTDQALQQIGLSTPTLSGSLANSKPAVTTQLLGSAENNVVGNAIDDTLTKTAKAAAGPARLLGRAGAIRVEAETLTRSTFRLENLTSASGGKAIGLLGGGSNEVGKASGKFNGPAGTYNIILNYHDEMDGTGKIEANVNGKRISTLTLNQKLGGSTATSGNKVNRAIATGITLKQGDTFELVGRENSGEHIRIDYIEFVPVDGAPASTARTPSPTAASQDPIRLEAESFSRKTYRVESNKLTSGGKVVSFLGGGSSESGSISRNFTGATGTYNVILGYFDEKDGKAQVETRIAGKRVATTVFDQGTSSDVISESSRVRRTIASNLTIKNGDKIELFGKENSGEHARIDYIEFVPVGGGSTPQPPTTPPTTPPPAPSTDTTAPTARVTAGGVTTAGGKTYNFSVTYSDNVAINTATIDGRDVRVTGPNGFNQVARLVNVNNSANGATRTATYQIDAPGGSWNNADNGVYNVALQLDQVKDTSGNSAPVGNLGTFDVNVASTPAAPPPPPAPGGSNPPANKMIFQDNFNNGRSSAWGEESGARSQITNENGALKFSVAKSDPKWKGWYRAEIKYSETDFLKGSHGFDFRTYFPPDYVKHSSQELITQWHGPTNGVWRGPNLGIFVRGGKVVVQGVWYPNGNSTPLRKIFWQGDYQPGQWIDWKFHTKFDKNNNGTLQVWKDGQQIVNFKGTNTDNQREWLMFKIGMYPGTSMSLDRRTIHFDDVKIYKLD